MGRYVPNIQSSEGTVIALKSVNYKGHLETVAPTISLFLLQGGFLSFLCGDAVLEFYGTKGPHQA